MATDVATAPAGAETDTTEQETDTEPTSSDEPSGIHYQSPYAVANVSEMMQTRNALLSAFDNIQNAAQVPADGQYGVYRNLDEAYAYVLRAADDIGQVKAQLKKLRDGAIAAADFSQTEMQFVPAR